MSQNQHAPHNPPPTYTAQNWRKKLALSGGSLKLVVPRPIARALGWGCLSEVQVYMRGQVMVVQTATPDGFRPAIEQAFQAVPDSIEEVSQ